MIISVKLLGTCIILSSVMDIIFEYSIGYHTRTHDYKDTQKSHYHENKGDWGRRVGGHEGVGSDKGIRREHNCKNYT